MRRSTKLRLGFSGLIAVVATAVVVPLTTDATAAPAPTWQNLVRNGDFEDRVGDSGLEDWHCTDRGGPTGRPASNEFLQVMPEWGEPAPVKPSTPPKPAKPTAALAATTAAVAIPAHGEVLPDIGYTQMRGAPTNTDRGECSQYVTVKPNTTYVLSGWVNGGYAELGVATHGTDYSTVSRAQSNDWTYIKTTFTTAPAPNDTNLRVFIRGKLGGQEMRADWIELMEASTRDSQVPRGTGPRELGSDFLGGGLAQLRWRGAPGATAYRVSLDGNQLGITTKYQFLVRGLQPETKYNFVITPLNRAGNGHYYLARTTTSEGRGEAPASWCGSCTVRAFASDSQEILVRWDMRVPGETDGYLIYLDGVTAGWAHPLFGAVLPRPARGWHQINVAALNSAGRSPMSSTRWVYTN